MAKNVVVVGTQWGDEGKGKIVDWLTDHAKGVVRFQGGHNAGHTLVVGDKVYKLNLVPSGIVRDGVDCFIGNGVVLDIHHLLEEIKILEAGGIGDVRSRLKISPGCPIILPYHAALDNAREAAKCADTRIGTTGKGIGPSYEDKVARRALRVYDLFYPQRFAEKLKENLDYHNFVLTRYLGAAAVDHDAVLARAMADAEEIKPLVTDVSAALHAVNKAGHNLLFEGAQGALLDIDHGTYPFVTSSNTVSANAFSGTGVGPSAAFAVVGICKAYTTRVGGGPFATELDDEIGRRLQEVGKEFGATTGRRRRCGWLDMVLVRHSVRVGGVTGIALTKLDVLTGIDKIKICIGYRTAAGEQVNLAVPADLRTLAGCEPVYEELEGWTEDISQARHLEELPKNVRKYLERIETLADVPLVLVSVGAARNETIILKNPFSS